MSGLATTLRERDVDQLYDDVADFVRKSPAVAVGIAAALGFVAVRLVKAGLPEQKSESAEQSSNASGGRKRRAGAKA